MIANPRSGTDAGPAHPVHLHGAEPCASCDARRDSVCSAMDATDLGRLAAFGTVSMAAPAHAFISEGDPADSFFSIRTGMARLFKSLPDGRRQITGFAGRGDFLGLAASASYGFSAEAIEPTGYCRFPRTRLRRLLDDFLALERRLLEVASTELVAAQEQMLLLGRKTARERVASFLLARSQTAPGAEPDGLLHLPMARGDIADYLGLTIETISRTLARLRTERLIAVPNTSDILVLDQNGMEAVAAGAA